LSCENHCAVIYACITFETWGGILTVQALSAY